MRPYRQMFKADKTDDGWKPVGFPNIEQRDVEQLERFNKVEPQNFGNITEQPFEPLDIYPVHHKVKSQQLSRGLAL